MSLLNILEYPDPRLRKIAAVVDTFNPELETFCSDLLETMYAAPGIGLAATQVDVHKRIIAVDVSENRNEPHVFVNPELILHGDLIDGEEGCLSVPGVYEQVQRAERITVNAQNSKGEAIILEAEGMLAICIQHECDHLIGKLFVDYLSNLKRNRIRKKLQKQQKQRA
jgi:peptide deformylase